MFFACDHSFTGPYLADPVSRKDRKAKEREGSIRSLSSSERTSSSSSGRSGAAFGGFFHRKSAKKAAAAAAAEKLGLPPPPTLSRTPSIATDDGIDGGGGSRISRRAPPPASAPTAAALATENLERLRVRAASCESLDGSQSRSPRAPAERNGTLCGEDRILDRFPLAPDSSHFAAPSQRGPWSERSSSRQLRLHVPPKDSRPPSPADSAGFAVDGRLRRGGLATIVDSEDGGRDHGPLPAPPSAPQTNSPFQMALARLENAGLKITLKRLAEDWNEDFGDGADGLEEALFEQKLWALVARQWLAQGKQLQCPAHEMLVASTPDDGRTILNLHGSIADGWVLAAKYPASTVHTFSTASTDRGPQTGSSRQSYSWPAPTNHCTSFIPASDGFFPFPDNHFDVITSRAFSTTVKSKSWLFVLQECHRCLKPGGWLEIQSLDALPSRPGELLTAWAEARLLSAIDECGLVARPSKKILDYFDIAGLGDIKSCRIALPVVARSGGAPEQADAVKVMVQAGRHYYSELYAEFLKGGAPWWWNNKTIRQECEKEGTMFGFMISFGRKD